MQFSDRVSASQSVGKELTKRALEVPWHFKLETLSRNLDEDLVEELGFEDVRQTRALGKDPLNRPLKARNGDALGAGIGVVPPLKRVFCSPLCGNQLHGAQPRRDIVPVTASARWCGDGQRSLKALSV